jgi:uncharacterized protein
MNTGWIITGFLQLPIFDFYQEFMSGNIKKISRKDFIKKSSIGIFGTGIIAGSTDNLLINEGSLAQKIMGNTGIKVTVLGLGATKAQAGSVVKYAVSKGINFLDTGRIYAGGKNEEMIGEALKGLRKKVVIQSKVSLAGTNITMDIGKAFNKSLEESLKALRTDYIDIFLLHDVSDTRQLFNGTLMKAFSAAKDEGKILATGFSTHSNQAALVRYNNENPFYEVIMVAFNHAGGFVYEGQKHDWNQDELIAELQIATSRGIGIVGMKTCSGGPYSGIPGMVATIPKAVRWVVERDYLHTSAVAMANFDEVDGHFNECCN